MILFWELIKKSSASLFRRVYSKKKKIQMSRFINTELKSDSEPSDSDLESEKVGSKFDNKLMTKLEKSGSDCEWDIIAHKWFAYDYK